MKHSIMVFGKTYESKKKAAEEFDIAYSLLLDRLRETSGFRIYDTELITSVGDMSGTKLELVGLDDQARYQVYWSKDLKTTREMIAHYRPDLLDLYNETNPTGEYHPYGSETLSWSTVKKQHITENVGTIELLTETQSENILFPLLLTYSKELGSIKDVRIYRMTEEEYLILSSIPFEENICRADWNITKEENGDIKTIWTRADKHIQEKLIHEHENHYTLEEMIYVLSRKTGELYGSMRCQITGERTRRQEAGWVNAWLRFQKCDDV